MLDPLRDAPESAHWPDPARLRQVATWRRRRRSVLIAVPILCAVIAAALLVGRDPAAPPARPVLAAGVVVGDRQGAAVQLVAAVNPAAPPAAPTTVATSSAALAVKLLRQLGGTGNTVVSPASLAIALSMLDLGARGRTEAEIAALIGCDAAAGWGTVTAQWAAQHDVQIEVANSLWQQVGFAVRAQFMNGLARYLRTGVWQVDFGGNPAGAADALNHWASAKTHGKVPTIVTPRDVRTWVLALANALYFKASWQTPFTETLPGVFHGSSDTQAQFMDVNGGFRSARTADYQAVELPYTGGRFSALAVMPTKSDLGHFVSGLDLGTVVRALVPGRVDVGLPRFTMDVRADLEDALTAMGMSAAFSPGADLSGIAGRPGDLLVDRVLQRTYLSVGEKGTEAAAATVIGVAPGSAGVSPRPFRFDRPFLFFIRDMVTGAVLFAAEVQNPS